MVCFVVFCWRCAGLNWNPPIQAYEAIESVQPVRFGPASWAVVDRVDRALCPAICFREDGKR